MRLVRISAKPVLIHDLRTNVSMPADELAQTIVRDVVRFSGSVTR